MRRDTDYNLAIETAARQGSLALGRGDTLLATVDLPVQRRHRVGLLPGIAALCAEHNVTPKQIGEAYVSLGPGSFTGLRVAMASTVALGLAGPMRFVGVPTLAALVRNTPQAHAAAAVCLNVKRDTMWCAVYERQAEGWRQLVEPALRTLDELLTVAPRPVALLGDPLPPLPEPMPSEVTVLPVELARPRAEAVWHIGQKLAREGRYTPSPALLPIYARPPEAVTLWDQRHGAAKSPSTNSKLQTRN